MNDAMIEAFMRFVERHPRIAAEMCAVAGACR